MQKNQIMNKKYFNIVENDSDVVLEIYGTIGESWWDDTVTFKKVSEQLKCIAAGPKKVLVRINSYGGDVNDALAIFELLHSMGNRVTTECVGFCASAATIIAMAGHTRRMSSYGLFLIHKCSSCVAGNENDLESELNSQRKVNDSIIRIYEDVTGCDRSKLEALMNEDNGNGVWLNIHEAMEYGFITEAIPETIEDKNKKASYEAMFKNLFYNHKKLSDMKKNIVAFAALAALLAVNELDAKDNKAILDDDQLKKINDSIESAIADKTKADQDRQEAEKAKQLADSAKSEAETKLAQAETANAALQARISELQAIIDKKPATVVEANGNDKNEESFEDWYSQQEHVKEAHKELGR